MRFQGCSLVANELGDRVAYVMTQGKKGAPAYELSECPIYVLEKGIPHTTADLLVVALRHPVEEFQKCLRELRAAETNLDFAYTLLPHPEGLTLVALHVEDVEFSQSVLHRAGVKILSQEELSR